MSKFCCYLLLAFLLPCGLLAQSQPLRVGIITDCSNPSLTALTASIIDETQKLLNEDVQIGASVVTVSSCMRSDISSALQSMLRDRNIDMIVGVGILTSDVLAKSGPYSKPVLASLVVNPVAQKISITQERTTGVANLSVIVLPYSPERDLDMFYRMVQFKKLAIIMDDYTLDNIPEFNQFLIDAAEDLGVQYSLIKSQDSVDDVLAAISDSTDAVYLLPTNRLGNDGKQALIDGINEKRIPSYSAIGRRDVDKGVLTGMSTLSNFSRMSRRVALDIQRILDGSDPEDIPVDLEFKEQLVLNAQVARQIRFNASWEFLAEALLVNDVKDDIDVKYDLKAAVALALEQNLDLVVAQKDLETTAQEVNLAKGILLPQVDASGSLSAIDEDRAEIGFGQSPEYQSFISGSLSQLIYSDQAFANKYIQERIFAAAEEQYKAQTLDLVLDVSFAFVNVLQAQTNQDIQKVNLEVTRKNLELARASQAIGQTGLSDVYRWQSEISIAKIDLIKAGVLLQQAEFELNRILNKKINEDFILLDVGGNDPMIIFRDARGDQYINNARDYMRFADFLVEEAMVNMPEVRSLQLSLEAQQRALKNAKREFYAPQVSISAGLDQEIYRGGSGTEFGLSVPGIPAITPPNDTYWKVGVGATLPVFTGFQRKAISQQQRLQTEAIMSQQASLQLAVETNVRSALENVRGSMQNIELSQDAEEASRKNFEIVQDSYSEGRVTITQLLDAQKAAISARLNKANAIYIFVNHVVTLERSVGDYIFLKSTEDKNEFFDRLSQYIAQ